MKESISFKSFMDLRNARLLGSTELFPADVLKRRWKSRCVYFMLRLSARLLLRTSLSRSRQRSCISRRLPASNSSSLSARPVSCPSGLWFRLLCPPPTLHPLLPAGVREEVLKVCSLPHSCRREVYSGGIGVFGSL